MKKKEMITRLIDLSGHCESMFGQEDSETIWKEDVEALNMATNLFLSECQGDQAQSIIRTILSKEKLNQQQLANMTGKSRQSISQMLTRGVSMRFSSFQKLVDVLGYEVICRKK